MTDEVITMNIRIEGDVQGVGFRDFAIREATARKLKGWVRNRTDGSLEAVASGPRTVVESFITACVKGPTGRARDRVQPDADRPARFAGLHAAPDRLSRFSDRPENLHESAFSAMSVSASDAPIPSAARLVTPRSCSRDAARHDPGIVREIGTDIEADAVIAHPLLQPHADGGDLVFAPVAAGHPDAHAAVAALTLHRQGARAHGSATPRDRGRRGGRRAGPGGSGRASHRPRAGRGRDRCTGRRGRS